MPSTVRYVDYIKAKCLKPLSLNIFRCVAGADYGADRKTLLRYKALVLPTIECVAVIYAGARETIFTG